MSHIGIDIGTSYSSVCILNESGQPERVKIATGTSVYGDSYSLPSAVFVEDDGTLLLGQAAMASRMRAPQNFKAEFKRDLGQAAPYLLGNKQYLPENLYKEFFIYIKKCVEDYTRDSVTDATVTFPASFNDNKKKLIETAAKRAGLLNVTMLDEPSAAAYCYLNAGKLKENDTLLVYDLGGGTFDLALMRMKDGIFEQLTQPMGSPRLGGTDIDKLIFNDIMAVVGEEKIEEVKRHEQFKQFTVQITDKAVIAKHHLSNSGVFVDVISVGYETVKYELTRERYNVMIQPIINDTMQQVKAILNNAGLKPEDLSKVLLVGGVSRTPLVGELLQRTLGKAPLKDADPELVVCEGAAIQSEVQGKIEKARMEEKQKHHEEQERKKQEAVSAAAMEAERKRIQEIEDLRQQVQVLQKTQSMDKGNALKHIQGKLTLKRKLQWNGAAGNMKIYLNDEFKERIATGQSMTMNLSAGHYRLQLKWGWAKSNIIEFDINAANLNINAFFFFRNGDCILERVTSF